MKHIFSIFLHIDHRQEAIDLGVRCDSEFELFNNNFEAFIAILTFLQFERFKLALGFENFSIRILPVITEKHYNFVVVKQLVKK